MRLVAPRHALLSASTAFGFASLVSLAPARAADSILLGQTHESSSEAPARPRREREPYPLSVGARAFIAPPLGVAGLGAGLDVAYSLLPNLALGGQYLTFAVDQGGDPDYCARCIRAGSGALVFAEGRLWPRVWSTPYARLGLGVLHLNGQRFAYDRGYSEDELALAGELGLELHHRAVSLRTFAFQLAIPSSELDSDLFAGFGAQLSARF